MKIPILNGIFADEDADFRTSYPRNYVPVPKQTGINDGYLRPADGLVQFDTTTPPGIDRGGFNWNGVLYRVLGTSFCRVDANGVITVLGDVGAGGPVTMDPSFDRLGISSGGRLYYWDTVTLDQVTDPDLGVVIDFIWVDGYFMTTDGTNLIVTELADPFAVNPLKYGSSEADPDPILGILKLKNEPYALNRYTIEVFDNIGGSGFPFSRIEGAQIQRGAVGTYAACVFMDAIAFLGSGRNEAPAVWLGVNSQTAKLSTREIDQVLQTYSDDQLALAIVEARVDKGHMHLYIHLPDQTLVYDGAASVVVKEPVWFSLTTSLVGLGQYLARNFIWCYNRWVVGDPTTARLGETNDAISSHYEELNGWDFGTLVVYNEGRGMIVHELELVALPGRVALGDAPVVWTASSVDGETWSQEHPCGAGEQGDRTKRIHWLGQGVVNNWRIQRFRGTSDCHVAFARLEARIEGLNF